MLYAVNFDLVFCLNLKLSALVIFVQFFQSVFRKWPQKKNCGKICQKTEKKRIIEKEASDKKLRAKYRCTVQWTENYSFQCWVKSCAIHSQLHFIELSCVYHSYTLLYTCFSLHPSLVDQQHRLSARYEL